MLPSTAFIGWFAVLLAGGAGTDSFDPERAWQAARTVTLGDVAVLVTAALVLSLVLNPFQFAATQLLEGYWGRTRWAAVAAAARINRHRQLLRSLVETASAARRDLKAAALAAGGDVPDLLLTKSGDTVMHLLVRAEAADDHKGQYPDPSRVLPTRLGNALRSFEDAAGKEYGLDALRVAGHLSLLVANERTAYVRDTRESLDLAVRLCMVFALATPITGLLMAGEGAWVVLALVPYAVAYLSYRGAILAAIGYGNAVRFQIDLDRFALYEALNVPEPATTDLERQMNGELMSVLSRNPKKWTSVSLRYRRSWRARPGRGG